MQRHIIAVGALAIGLGGTAQAQVASTDDVTQLERITITTPLRRESSLERSTSSVTVIGEEEIRRSPASDLPGLLKSFAGVTVTSSGGMGSSTGVSLRGAKAGQTLILVNGVNIRSATAGSTAFHNIPLDAIERIEIARGPHSAQYGSDAIGGVINIITRAGGACVTGNDVCTTVSAGVSHPWGGHAGVDVRGETGPTRFAFGGRVIGTRGYDFTISPLELDDDGFLQGSLDFNVSRDFDWGELYTSGLYSRARTQYDNTSGGDDQADTDLFAGKLGARIDHDESWSTTLELSSGIDRSKNFRKGTPINDYFNTYRYGIFGSTQKTFDTGDFRHVVNVGGEANRDRIASHQPYPVKSRDTAAAFAQYTMEFAALTVDAGIRHDDNEQFGGATTYNLGASYEFVPGLVGRASYGTGFRAPTFNDLYWPTGGNPDLRPEKSRSYEVGLRWQANEATALDLAFYQRWVRDQIAWAPAPTPTDPFRWLPSNFERVKVTGFELSLDHRFNDRWSARGTLDIRDPRDELTGNYLPGQDRFKASAEVNFAATGKLDLGARLVFGASRFSDAANTQKLPDYTTLDLTAIYRHDDRSVLKLAVENVFDEEYSTVRNYRAPGRTINVSYSRTF